METAFKQAAPVGEANIELEICYDACACAIGNYLIACQLDYWPHPVPGMHPDIVVTEERGVVYLVVDEALEERRIARVHTTVLPDYRAADAMSCDGVPIEEEEALPRTRGESAGNLFNLVDYVRLHGNDACVQDGLLMVCNMPGGQTMGEWMPMTPTRRAVRAWLGY